MYKAHVRSHLDYCDIIFHEPSQQNQPSLGVTLNSLMEKVERIQYQAALAVTGAWKAQIVPNSMKSYGGKLSLIVVFVGVFYRFIRL